MTKIWGVPTFGVSLRKSHLRKLEKVSEVGKKLAYVVMKIQGVGEVLQKEGHGQLYGMI